MIFLNHAANGLMPNSTVQAITDYLHAEQQRSPHLAELDAAPQLQQLYPLLAELLGSQPQDIALTSGNSHGWTAVVGAMPWQAGDKVLIAPGEWGGNVSMLQHLQSRHGISVQTMPCLADGSLDLPTLELLLQTDQQIKLLALTWVPANGAIIYSAEAVGALCSQYKVTFVVDAAQALGHFPVDVQRLQCDALTAPGRKWINAPRGTGLLYVHPRLLPKLQPLVVDHQSRPITAEGAQLRSDARRFELSESAISLKLGSRPRWNMPAPWAGTRAMLPSPAGLLSYARPCAPCPTSRCKSTQAILQKTRWSHFRYRASAPRRCSRHCWSKASLLP